MNQASPEEQAFRDVDRPEIALITNHGYAGVDIPIGGAPDTGGQNVYVNNVARALDGLGFKVTVFTRGGFPNFQDSWIRRGQEYMNERVRYVFVPGGGDNFLRKEDIAIALDEELDWLDAFIRREAGAKGCRPWEVYEFVNSHYWDGGVLGVRLIERWKNDLAVAAVVQLLSGTVSDEVLDDLKDERNWRELGEAPGYHLGRILIDQEGSVETPLEERVRKGVAHWAAAQGLDEQSQEYLNNEVLETLQTEARDYPPALKKLAACGALGRGLMELSPVASKYLSADLTDVDRHVWTPHSLGELKRSNFRDRSPEELREFKFTERLSHERMICHRTRAFAATSAEIAERLWIDYRVSQEETYYFPPCVDLDVFRPYDEEELEPTYEYLSRMSGVSSERLKRGRIVFETGRMVMTKRKDLLIAAFAKIARDHQDAYLFIGGGPKNDHFRSLSHQIDFTMPIEKHAFLLGPVPEEHIGPMFSLADVYATGSEMEGYGMTVAQSAAAATLVVSSDKIPFSAHHIPQFVVLFPAGDVEAFADALHQALDDEVNRRERSTRLAKEISSLDWTKKSAGLIEFLRSLGMSVSKGKVES